MKLCRRCGETKPLDAFNKRTKNAGGLRVQPYCKECQRAYQRERPHAKAARKFVTEAKNRPCADCGVQYPHYVMDLDHRPGTTKKAGFNVLVKHGASRALLAAEIAKCDVVCANCHRIRTYQRKQWTKRMTAAVAQG
jgi:hypothetical protein